VVVVREIELFKKMFKDIVEKRGYRVEWFGSTKDSSRWKKGRSDLDIFVYSRIGIPSEVKAELVLLVRDLNYELGLELENVPFMHWTPIFIDSPTRFILKTLSREGIVRYFTESLRRVVKSFSNIWWPITYRDWWDIVEYAYRNRLSPLPMPPPYPPTPPSIFLKLL